MARYRFKAFDPKPFTPGARIEWTHTAHDGCEWIRTGTVWSLALAQPGVRRAVWVTPDSPLPGDLYRALYVIVRTDGSADANDDPESYSGYWTRDAFDVGRRTRDMNARIAHARAS